MVGLDRSSRPDLRPEDRAARNTPTAPDPVEIIRARLARGEMLAAQDVGVLLAELDRARRVLCRIVFHDHSHLTAEELEDRAWLDAWSRGCRDMASIARTGLTTPHAPSASSPGDHV